MPGFRTRTALFLFVTLVAGALSLAPAVAESGRQRPRYLALGDSVTVGRRASNPFETGFVPLLAQHLSTPASSQPSVPSRIADDSEAFSYANFGRLNEETTSDMINQGQLTAASALLRSRNGNASHRDDIDLVTLTIGANDVRSLLSDPRCVPVPTAACQAAVGQALAAVSANLETIMGTLRTAAGPGAVIATMTYYNPLIGACTPPGPLGNLIPQALASLNGIITQAASHHDVVVAPVSALGLGAGDFFGDCIHPNDSGYAKIATAFAAVIDPLLQ